VRIEIPAKGARTRHLDYSSLTPEDFESLVGELLVSRGLDVRGRGRGPDDGRDLIATEIRSRSIGPPDRFVTLVQCKHNGSRALAVQDLDSIVDRCAQHGANHYLLVCSGKASAALARMRDDFERQRPGGPSFTIWDGVDLERELLQPEFGPHLARFFEMAMRPPSPSTAGLRSNSCSEAQERLASRFGLHRVVACETPSDYALLSDALGSVAAQYFTDNAPENAVVGVSCGRTVFTMADSLPRFRRRLRVYPISFNVGPTLTGVMSPWATIFRICEQVSGAEGYEIPLPAFLKHLDAETSALQARADIYEQLSRSHEPTIAFYSVGHLEAGSSYDWAADHLRYVVPGFSTADLRSLGACGEINWYPFDESGHIIDHPLVKHGTSLSLAAIKDLASTKLHQMVLIAGGHSKVRPILGALRGGFLNVLISDAATIMEVDGLTSRS
jgi:DNA-binding transcriptional regulator LsrR (DeoR family)